MVACKNLKILYVSLVVVLEADSLVNTDAMKWRREIDTASHYSNEDSRNSLESCFSHSLRYGIGLHGNLTRHHRRVHRRQKTTTVTSTVSTTPLHEATTSLYNSESYQTTLRSQQHYEVQTGKDFELYTAKSMVKVKKIQKDSFPNSIGNNVRKSGVFLTDNCTTVVAQIGTTAVLHCEVSDITENTVTWIRRKDYSLLSVGLVTYSADTRFFSAHGRHVKDWALHVKFVSPADGGYYECQVPTHPPTSIFFKLVLVAAFADIMGESEKIVQEGSMLRLTCQVRKSTEPPSYVFWYFGHRMINYDQNGISVRNLRQSSELVIERAEPRHAGNYTCVPANARNASVTVHVVQSEAPAAMQHENTSGGLPLPKLNEILLSVSFLLLFTI